jgi:hypothetical protein
MCQLPEHNAIFSQDQFFGISGNVMDVHHQLNSGQILEDIHPWQQAGVDYFHYYGDNAFFFGQASSSPEVYSGSDHPFMGTLMRVTAESFNDTVIQDHFSSPHYRDQNYNQASMFSHPNLVTATAMIDMDQNLNELFSTVFLMQSN